MRFTSPLLAVVLAVLAAPAANATHWPVYLGANVSLSAPGMDSCQSTADPYASPPTPAYCVLNVDSGQSTVAANSTGNVNYGNLTLSSSGALTSSATTVPSGPLASTGNSGAVDTLVISNAPKTGILAITLGYSEETSVSCTGLIDAQCSGAVTLSLQNGGGPNPNISTWSSIASGVPMTVTDMPQSTQSSGTLIASQAYVGTDAIFSISLLISATCALAPDGSLPAANACNYAASGSVWVEKIKVLNSAGKVVRGAKVTSLSGTNYN